MQMNDFPKIPVILDGDPGHDDAIAWTIAHGSGRFRILAVTTAAGNQTIEKTTYNARRVCTLIGLKAPIARGCSHPLLADLMNAPSIHGETGLDVTEKALIYPEDFERIRSLGNPVSEIVWQWLEFFYRFHRNLDYKGAPMHDPCAVMALIHPEIFTMRDYYVQIETGGDYCRGATVPDWYGITGEAPNATCLVDVDREAFADALVGLIAAYGKGVAE